MKKHLSNIICILGVALSVLSCQQEDAKEHSKKNREIAIREGVQEVVTKSSSAYNSEEILFSIPVFTDNGDTLSIVASLCDMEEDFAAESAVTKAAPITTENLPTKYGKFKTTVFTSAGAQYTDDLGKTMNNIEVSYGSDEWTLAGAPYRWPASATEDIIFCSYSPLGSDTGVSNLNWNSGNKVTFDYKYDHIDASPNCDASNQKDIIFAINSQNRTDHDGYAHINFSHALVGVKFIKGDIENCELSSVTLNNFYSKGSAEGTPVSDTDLEFVWKNQAVPQSYSQTFTGAKNVDELADKASLDPTEDESYTFMMIPQKLTADASVSISLKYGTSSYQTITVNLGSITDDVAGTGNAAKLKDWSTYAGKILKIRVNRGDLAVDVDESFEDGGSVKADVGAKNTGGKIEFVRACIVANWVDEDGNIHATCDFENDNVNLVDYLKSGCNWVHAPGDRFYYYEKAILPGAVTKGKIFTSYTEPEAPEEGLHLEMTVIVQGVEYDSSCAKAIVAWGLSDDILTSEIEY